MKKTKKPLPSPRCGRCVQPIDPAALDTALKNNIRYVHTCGKVLVKGTNP